jgi:hypothetical protein
VTRRVRRDGGPHWDQQRDPYGTGDPGGGHPNDRPGAVHAANKRRNRMTLEAFQRVAEIARAHPKAQEARDDALVSDDAYRAHEDALDLSPRTAQRWVKRAQEAGPL